MPKVLLIVTGRLLLIAAAALLLGLLWLFTGVAALSGLDDVCFDPLPADANGYSQSGSLWPPRLECRYETPGGTVVVRQDGEVRRRVAAAGVTGAAALGALITVTIIVIRRPIGRDRGERGTAQLPAWRRAER